MSVIWADRQRRTNKLVRAIAGYFFEENGSLTSAQLYGLCKLTWITKSYSASYIVSTKIPALGEIFNRNYSGVKLDAVAAEIASILKSPEVYQLILSHTGFTNFYGVFRNSARDWIDSNTIVLSPLFRDAYELKTDDEALSLIKKIEMLPGISKPNQSDQLMDPGHLLTPAFFALDPRLRFPLINGGKRLTKLLATLKVRKSSLSERFDAVIALIGSGNIEDAADLDQLGSELHNFVGLSGNDPMLQRLAVKPTEGDELTLKDDSDIESMKLAQSTNRKRIHNTLTNNLRRLLDDYTLLEGRSKVAQFDVMVKDFDGNQNDLLIEVKSSTDVPDVRMAIGQLYSYWFELRGKTEWERTHLAILLPAEPGNNVKRLLDWCDLGLLWFNQQRLETCSPWLKCLTAR